jgi:hypothetical protein
MAQRDSALKFVCPVCEASPQERCHVNARILCFESHWERRELATNMTSANASFAGQDAFLPRKWRVPNMNAHKSPYTGDEMRHDWGYAPYICQRQQSSGL